MNTTLAERIQSISDGELQKLEQAMLSDTNHQALFQRQLKRLSPRDHRALRALMWHQANETLLGFLEATGHLAESCAPRPGECATELEARIADKFDAFACRTL